MRNKGDWMLLIAAMIGGGGFIGGKYLLDWGFSPYQVLLGRFLVAAAALSIIYGRRYKKISSEEWKTGTVLGALLAATFFLITIGLQYTTPSVNAFLCNTQAVIVPLICWLVFKERPSGFCFIAALMTVVGIALISVTDGMRLDIGAVLSFGASLAFSVQMVLMGKTVKKCDPIHIALVEHLAAAAIFFVIVIIRAEEMPPLGLPSAGSFLYLGLFCNALYFVLQSMGQRYTSSVKTAIIITTESIFAAVISALIYGEHMSGRGLIGCGIIFIAMLIAEDPRTKGVDRA